MIKSFIKDFIKYLPAHIVPAITGFISIPIITRIFPPEIYGNYSLAMATIMILTTLLSWIPLSTIRFYTGYEIDKKLDIFYGTIVKLNLISILPITIIFITLLFFIKANLTETLFILLLLGAGVSAVTCFYSILQGVLSAKRQVAWYSGFVTWNRFLSLGLGLALIIWFKSGIKGLLWGTILSITIILPILWKKAIGNIPVLRSSIDFTLGKQMAKYSFPLVAGNLAAWVLSLSDRYILEFFRGSQEVGIYSASYNITNQSIMLLVNLFMMASWPIATQLWEKEGISKTREFISNTTRYYLMACIPAIVGMSVLSKHIISILTGQQFFEGYKVIPFVTFGIFFLGLQQRYHPGILLHNKTALITLAVVLSGLVNLGLNFFLIPKYGYMAAAWSTLISYAFLLFIIVFGSHKIFVWDFPYKSLIKVSFASVIMGATVYYISNKISLSVAIDLIICVIVGGLIYIFMLFFLREFNSKENIIFKRILAHILPNRFVPDSWRIL